MNENNYENVYKTDPLKKPIYESWLRFANERDILENVLRDRFEEWCHTKPLSMIEWGCGLGSAAKRFMNILVEKEVTFDYTGVDPFQDQLDRFRQSLKKEENVHLEVGDFETYNPNRKRNLALAIHSLYYANDFETTLAKIVDSSEKMFLVHHGLNGINKIHEEFPQWVIQEKSEISTHIDVCEALDILGIRYDLTIYNTQTDIRACHDPTNIDGRNMIQFFLDHPSLSDDCIKTVSDYLRNIGDAMNHDMAVIIT